MATRRRSDNNGFNLFPGEQELVVVAKKQAGLRVSGPSIESATGANTKSLETLCAERGFELVPLFGLSEDRIARRAESVESASPDAGPLEMALYYKVRAPEEMLEGIRQAILNESTVEGAYIKPPSYPPFWVSQPGIVTAQAAPNVAPPNTSDFTARQLYLDAAPGGVDARFAWTVAGGRGDNVQIIDIEGAWRFTHEDLAQNQGGVVGGTPSPDLGWRNHGTAVVGVFGADVNSIGVTGICPNAHTRAISIFGGLGSAAAIRQGADLLRPGDVMLLELHRPGPRFNFASNANQTGFIAIEWWPDDFDAIRYAIGKGIVVVEAAGNGAEDLDAAVYETAATGFPASWKNPFRRANRESGAIRVGAGAPPPGTHGNDHGPDRSRLGFSNWGALIDVQGWGQEVTTTGGRHSTAGDLQGGANEDVWYTDTFAGTSSASPIVVGTLGCVQGVLRAQGRIPLTPARARALLRETGSPQQASDAAPLTQRIGNRPNLRQLIASVTDQRQWNGVQFSNSVPANETRSWFTPSWPAHWHVVWTVVPRSPLAQQAQITWKVQVQRQTDALVTYHIHVTNLSNQPVEFEARFAVMGW